MTPVPFLQPQEVNLQFVDEAHAEFYDLGRRALSARPVDLVEVRSLRDRMLPFMDLTDARSGSAFVASMGGRERRELRQCRFVGARRFAAWAMEFAVDADTAAAMGCRDVASVYDPDELLGALIQQARSMPRTRRWTNASALAHRGQQ